FGVLISSVLVVANVILLKKDELLVTYGPMIKDDFALGNLSTPLPMQGWEPAAGVIYLVAIMLSVFLLRKNFVTGSLLLFVSTIAALQITTYTIVPKIEEMVQGEATRFYREKGKEDAYLGT